MMFSPSAATRLGVKPNSEMRAAIAASARPSTASALTTSSSCRPSNRSGGACGSRAEAAYSTSPTTPQGDTTRPNFLYDRLTSSQRSFTNATGFDGSTATSTGTVSSFVQRVVAGQGQASEQAKRLDEGQQVAFASVQSRFLEDTKVNVDEEMSMLIELQSAYAANARVISTVKELLDVLMRL